MTAWGFNNRQFLDIPAEFRPDVTTTPQMTTTTAVTTTPSPTTTSEAEQGKIHMNLSFITTSTNNFKNFLLFSLKNELIKNFRMGLCSKNGIH